MKDYDYDEHKCKGCRTVGDVDNPVTYAPDPYNEDIHGDNTKVWLCANCRHEYSMDI